MKHQLLSLFSMLVLSATCCGQSEAVRWTPIDIAFEAAAGHDWWELPVKATFTHEKTGRTLHVAGFFNGERRYVIRFAAPLAGQWRYVTDSADDRMGNQSGEINVREVTPTEIDGNPNLRGQLRISENARCFTYADGTPFFLLADTNWSINTLRCGLGDNADGPFYRYLKDRRDKKFTTLLMSAMRGFGDTKEPHGQANEGGYPFPDGDTAKLNEAYFASLDLRMNEIWKNGFAVGMHPTWFGKLNCFFDHATAMRISRYLAVRYGAYNALWSLSGEYQYAMRDCGWTDDQINQLGNAVAEVNPYRHPLSIHPSSRPDWKGQHGLQSSRAFQNSGWLDHHWLQTGQKVDTMYLVPERIVENRALQPTRPVFLSESYYERSSDKQHVYHTRWQAWVAFLNGAAGYSNGAWGVWNFYDPDAENGETGKSLLRRICG